MMFTGRVVLGKRSLTTPVARSVLSALFQFVQNAANGISRQSFGTDDHIL
jgi:hypothetical protein